MNTNKHRKPHIEWTPLEHIEEACALLDKTSGLASKRGTGNAPIGMVEAGVHAAIAKAKLMQMVTEVRQ